MGDLPSVRGYKAILISCDNAKEREAVKESMNLINETIEAIYKDQQQDQQSGVEILCHSFIYLLTHSLILY